MSCSRAQRSEAGEALTRNLSVSSQALSHCAPNGPIAKLLVLLCTYLFYFLFGIKKVSNEAVLMSTLLVDNCMLPINVTCIVEHIDWLELDITYKMNSCAQMEFIM